MLFTVNDLKHHSTFTGAQILELFFGKWGARYLGANNPDSSPNKRFQVIRKFIEWVKQAVMGGKLQEVGEYYHTGGFRHGRFNKDEFFRWIQEDKIISDLENAGIEIVNDLKKALKQPNKKQEFLPAPEGTKWKDVSIKIKEDTRIEIKVNKHTKLYDLEKFKKEVIKQAKSRNYLYLLIQSGGIITRDSVAPDEDKGKFRTNVSRLRESLQKAFGIDAEPLPNKGPGEYQAQFSVSYENKPQQA